MKMKYPAIGNLIDLCKNSPRRVYSRGTIHTFDVNGIPTPTETQPLAGGSLLRKRTPEQVRNNEIRIATEAFRKIRQLPLNRKSPAQVQAAKMK